MELYKKVILRRLTLLMLLCIAFMQGCASMSIPRIDPSGERIFLPQPASPAPYWPQAAFPKPAYPTPPKPNVCVDPALVPATSRPALVCPPSNIAVAPIEAPIQQLSTAKITLTPSRVIAPVGSEVVLTAGLCGADGFYETRKNIEWMMSQESVGGFIQLGNDRSGIKWCRYLHEQSRKISTNYAIGRTSTRQEVLTRGTYTRADDVWLQKGQTWISLTSATEGTSHVTAFAPEAVGWENRRQIATVHWVDAQWIFPSPKIARASESQTLTTSVSRHTNSSAVEGWIVRYEYVDGPLVNFTQSGNQIAEVRTGVRGTATVEIIPQESGPGLTRIRVQVIRPGDALSSPLKVGQGETSVTWSAPQLSLDISGPAVAETESTAVYRIVVSNPGDLATNEIEVIDELPAELSYLTSSLEATVFGNRLSWQIPELGPHEEKTIELECRVESGTEINHCASATSADGLEANDCVTTNVLYPSISLKMTGPENAQVGDEVVYNITITNLSTERLTGIVLRDEFDDGLSHAESGSPIERSLGDRELAPGDSIDDLKITFTVTKAGTLCHKMEVTADGCLPDVATMCLTATEKKQVLSQSMTVEISGPDKAQVGEMVSFFITVNNTGDLPLSGLEITNHFPKKLEPKFAAEGSERIDDDLIWKDIALPPGERLRFEIQALCEQTGNACCTVSVKSNDKFVADESCIEIEPGISLENNAAEPPEEIDPGITNPPKSDTTSGKLLVTIYDNADPAIVDESFIYYITVTNSRDESDKQVSLVLHLPDHLQLDDIQGDARTFTKLPTGNSYSIEPIAEILAKDSRYIRAFVTPLREGSGFFQVEVTSLFHPGGSLEPFKEETTITK